MDKFKETFEKALKGGEGFSAAANNCIDSSMAQFDEACAGNKRFSLCCLLVKSKLRWRSKTCNEYTGKGKMIYYLVLGAPLLGFGSFLLFTVWEVNLIIFVASRHVICSTKLQLETDILLLQMLLLNKQTGIRLKYARNCVVILMHMLHLCVQLRFLS